MSKERSLKCPPNQTFVRKEFRRIKKDTTTYHDETHNLNLLNELKHPNIVEFLSSYTYNGKHNLLFPYARDGDLSTLLSQKDRPAAFHLDEVFFIALGQLSSAIEMVHDYASEKLGLRLMGCHHDLKPKNILVNGDKFILADFGLSTFKPASESSKSTFDIGRGHYLAPECEDYEGDFEKHTISRPSDIWSFGCIIAEVFTYMERGNEGVSDFTERRGFKVANWRMYTFHAGMSTPNKAVTSWLEDLETHSAQHGRLLIQLVRSMLAMEPKDRPTAPQVTSYLHLIAVYAYISLLDGLYEVLFKTTELFEADIEFKRFKSWRTVFESSLSGSDPWACEINAKLHFENILKYLVRSREEIESIISRYQNTLSPLFSGIRFLNDQLIDLFPKDLQERARNRLEILLVETEDSDLLQETVEGSENSSLHKRIGLLATIKRMCILAQQRKEQCRPDLMFDRSSLISMEAFGNHHVVRVKDILDRSGKMVLVEWVRYDTHWEGPVSKDMIVRVEAIAELLNSSKNPADFRALHCYGFFHEPEKHAFGLVYEFPTNFSEKALILRTLADVFRLTKDSRDRPPLGDRFSLARKVSTAVLEFHKVGWLHKSISAYNIVFFNPQGLPQMHWITTPHIIGFNLSRPDGPKAFTQGPPASSRYSQYHHPCYTNLKMRFRPDFDYYSLGIVLLEIGLWKTLDDMTAGWNSSSRGGLQEMLLEKRVPLLGHAMGLEYRDAVSACLGKPNGFGVPMETEWTPEKATTIHLAFELQVVERLGKCFA